MPRFSVTRGEFGPVRVRAQESSKDGRSPTLLQAGTSINRQFERVKGHFPAAPFCHGIQFMNGREGAGENTAQCHPNALQDAYPGFLAEGPMEL